MNGLPSTQIGIVGDWHSNSKWGKVALNTFDQSGIRTILHLGDFGIHNRVEGYSYMDKINSVLEENQQTLYVTLGNHENYDEVERLTSHPTMTGFVYNPLFPNILVASRGVRWEWNNVTFLSLGGANSIDCTGRVEGVDWWRQEIITEKDVTASIEGGYVDVIVSHDCPLGVKLLHHDDTDNIWSASELEYSKGSRIALRNVVDKIKPEILFHGHHHSYYDSVTILNDGSKLYSQHTVGLDMDGSQGNMIVFNLEDKTYKQLSVAWDRRNYI